MGFQLSKRWPGDHERGKETKGGNSLLQSDLTKDITTSVLLVNNKPSMVTLDYTVQVPPEGKDGSPELRYTWFRGHFYRL